jgi:hypothetical protein
LALVEPELREAVVGDDTVRARSLECFGRVTRTAADVDRDRAGGL